MKAIYTITLTLEVPQDTYALPEGWYEAPLTTQDVKAYVQDAIVGWGGQFHPDHWAFEGVKVSRMKVLRTKPSKSSPLTRKPSKHP